MLGGLLIPIGYGDLATRGLGDASDHLRIGKSFVPYISVDRDLGDANRLREGGFRLIDFGEVWRELHEVKYTAMVFHVNRKNTGLVFEPAKPVEYHSGMSEIRRLRKALGMRQHELALLADTSQPQIARLEKDQRDLTKEWAERLAPHLGVSPVALMFPEGPHGDSIDEDLKWVAPEFAEVLANSFRGQIADTIKITKPAKAKN